MSIEIDFIGAVCVHVCLDFMLTYAKYQKQETAPYVGNQEQNQHKSGLGHFKLLGLLKTIHC